VTPDDNVMYHIDVGPEGQAALYTNYLRVLAHNDVTGRSVTEYFVEAANLGADPETLCATVTVHDFAGASSAPVTLCGSTEEPGGTGGETSGSGGGTSDSGGGSASGTSGGTESSDSTDGTGGSDGSGGGEDDHSSSCACRAGRPAPSPWLATFPVILAWRRRR
jgi:hypothetical protein